MDASHVEQDLVNVLFTEKQIQDRLAELARDIEGDYDGQDLLIVGILRGAVMVMADLARSLSRHVEMDWMAISSYGSGTKSSGVVRILKDLDTDISGRHVPSSRTSSTPASRSPGWWPTSGRAAPPRSRSARCCASPRPCR